MTPRKSHPQRVREAAEEVGVTLPTIDHEDYSSDIGVALLRTKEAFDQLQATHSAVCQVSVQRAEEIKGFKKQLTAYDTELNTVKTDLAQHKDVVEELRKRVATYDAELNRANAERVNLINKLAKAERDIEGAAERERELETVLDGAQRNATEWQAEATKHRETAVELRQRLNDAETTCERLRWRIDSLEPPTDSITLDSPGAAVVKLWRHDQTLSVRVTAEDDVLRACVAAVFREAVTLP